MSAVAAYPRIRRLHVRPGHCYEVAWAVADQLHDAGHDPAIVHAVLSHPFRGPMGHAWVELDCGGGTVIAYDLTIRREPWPRALYYKLFAGGATVRRYVFEEAGHALLAAGHYGPWLGDPAVPAREAAAAEPTQIPNP